MEEQFVGKLHEMVRQLARSAEADQPECGVPRVLI